jgi:ankyrin repeat protein
LLEKGAKIESFYYATMDPLFVAAREGYAEIMKLLLQYGAVMNDQNLSVAFRQNHAEAVKICLDHGANAQSLLTEDHCKKMLDSASIVLRKLDRDSVPDLRYLFENEN